MKKNIRYIIGIVLLIVFAIVITVILFIHSKNSNKLTGYQLVLEAHYGGSSIDGEDLGSGTKLRKYNDLEAEDKFYEPFIGGSWECNIPKEKQLKSEDNPERKRNGFEKNTRNSRV